jgi:uncharacterized repeat protein (TIGR01451 family)
MNQLLRKFRFAMKASAVPLSIAVIWVVGVMLLSLAHPADAEEVVVTCRAETISDDGGYNVSDQAGCTVPDGVTVTRAVLHTILDDGGQVYLNGGDIFSRQNTPGIKEDYTNINPGLSGGQNFTLRVDAVNAVGDDGRGLGPVYGMAELVVYGNRPAPPTHLTCQNNACVRVDGAGADTCSSNAQCQPQTHFACQNNACVSVAGGGANTCSSNADCAPAPTHLTCQNNACVRVSGAGADTCSSNAQCAPQTHLTCQNNACVRVDGAGADTCTSNAQCAPQTHKACSNSACVVVAGAGADTCTSNSECVAPTHLACQNNACVTVAGAGADTCTSNAQCAPAAVTCSPSSQTANINQTVNFSASGGNGSFNWTGGSNPVTGTGASYSTVFSAAGSYAVTVTSGGASAICAVTVNQVSAPTVTISANPSTINQGQTSVLTWSSTNATSCSASGGWSGAKSLSGTETVSPQQTTTYTITCVNGTGQSATASATVNVTTVVNNPTVTLTANPSSIQQGQTSVLNWTSTNTNSCTVSGGWSGSRNLNGSETVSPQQTTTYYITCYGTNGQQVNANATVYVNTVSQVPSVTLNVNPSYITRGQSSVLSWQSNNATQCYASGGWSGNVPLSGTQTVYPQFTTTYTINCTNGTNFAQDSKTVIVNDTCTGTSCCNTGQYGNTTNCPANNLQVTKTALNRTLNQTGYAATVEAQGLDVIEFEIRVRNLDNGYGTVTVRDILPQELFYVPNSTTLDGAPAQDGITTSGLQVGQIGPQQERVIRFRAVVFSGISNRTVTNQVSATMNAGVQNAYATISIRSRGQVLGAADIVTGPDDVLPWVMLIGLLGSVASYFAVFKFKLVNLGPLAMATAGPMSELERIVLEIRSKEKRPDIG